MLDRSQQFAVRHLVTAQLVCDDHLRNILQTFEQPPEELPGRQRVSVGLDQHIEHVAMLIDSTPQIMLPTIDPNEHLVEVPLVAGLWVSAAELVGVGLPEFGAPPADGMDPKSWTPNLGILLQGVVRCTRKAR